MMPVIRISDETYAKLQSLAKPFVDTPEAVIARLADAALTGGVAARAHAPGATSSPASLDPESPGSLKHTRLRHARLNGQEVPQPNWNKLSRTAHALGMELLPPEQLRRVSGANIRSGRYESEGFAYLADADISIQGQDSDQAWRSALALAKELQMPIEVTVEWHNKEDAAFPGEQRRIAWTPDSEH